MGYRQNLRPSPTPGMDTADTADIMDTLTDTVTDTDTTEESGLLRLNPKQKLKPHLGTDTVDITAGTDTLTDTDTDTTEENDLLMPNLQLMPKLSHGTMLDTTDPYTYGGYGYPYAYHHLG